MGERETSFRHLTRKPSGWLPLAMSFAALATVVTFGILFPVGRQADEGAPAHIFQLLMVAQVPVMGFFAVKWLPRNARAAIQVLALQVAAAIIPFALLYYLERLSRL